MIRLLRLVRSRLDFLSYTDLGERRLYNIGLGSSSHNPKRHKHSRQYLRDVKPGAENRTEDPNSVRFRIKVALHRPSRSVNYLHNNISAQPSQIDLDSNSQHPLPYYVHLGDMLMCI